MSTEEELEELQNLIAEYESASVEVAEYLATVHLSTKVSNPVDLKGFERLCQKQQKALDNLNDFWGITPQE